MEFSTSFSLLFLLGQATAGAHCREELRPLNRSLSRREHAEKNPDLSTRWESNLELYFPPHSRKRIEQLLPQSLEPTLSVSPVGRLGESRSPLVLSGSSSTSRLSLACYFEVLCETITGFHSPPRAYQTLCSRPSWNPQTLCSRPSWNPQSVCSRPSWNPRSVCWRPSWNPWSFPCPSECWQRFRRARQMYKSGYGSDRPTLVLHQKWHFSKNRCVRQSTFQLKTTANWTSNQSKNLLTSGRNNHHPSV